MLEKDNIFLRRYNEITGANVDALFEYGMPYFFGGRENLYGGAMKNYPNYSTKVFNYAHNTKFYRVNSRYIYGFDCYGYIQWINNQVGLPDPIGLQSMITDHKYRATNHIYNGGTKWTSASKDMPPYNELKDTLLIGDLLVTNDGSRHVMMYIGTLNDYGFTAEEVPELAEYLDYPLVIHCGPSPFYGARFEEMFQKYPDLYGKCSTTDGGVEVSIVGVPQQAFPYHEHVQLHDYDYFLIDDGNYMLSARYIDTATSFCWFRQ